jgi:hypothetical protein
LQCARSSPSACNGLASSCQSKLPTQKHIAAFTQGLQRFGRVDGGVRPSAGCLFRALLHKGWGLISYGPSIIDQCQRVATFVGKILRGAKPADLPVVRFSHRTENRQKHSD